MPIPQTPLLAVDVIIRRRNGQIILIRRANPPFAGCWALPGGFVKYGERVEEAAIREAKEETGLDIQLERIVGIFSDPGRDPRGHVVSICFLARERGGILKSGSDAEEVVSIDPQNIKNIRLAFDHREMLMKAGIIPPGF